MDEWTKAFKQDPKNVDALYNLAVLDLHRALEKAGGEHGPMASEREAAANKLRKAVEGAAKANFDFIAARELLGELEKRELLVSLPAIRDLPDDWHWLRIETAETTAGRSKRLARPLRQTPHRLRARH